MKLGNVVHLGLKELRSLAHDPFLAIFVAYSFSIAIYTSAKGQPETVRNAAVAIVDEDQSQLSARIIAALAESRYFKSPVLLSRGAVDDAMDHGVYAFVVEIPPDFERDVRAGHKPAVQISIDATRAAVAYIGSGYIEAMLASEVGDFVTHGASGSPLVNLVTRIRFNANLTRAWFTSVLELINQITMLSIVLTGAALIREREHGTIEHLLVMPLSASEIVLAKIWSMAAVVMVATAFALQIVVRRFVGFPIEGSVALFLVATALHLFATTSMGIFAGTVVRTMPQLGILIILVLIPLNVLSGGMTPRESQPGMVRAIMSLAPTTHFVKLAQTILFRAAPLRFVWPDFAALAAIGTAFYAGSVWRFRRSTGSLV